MPAHGQIGWSCSSVSCPAMQMLMAPLRPEGMRAVTKEHCLFLALCHQLPRMKWCQVESLVSDLHDDNLTVHFCGRGGASRLSSSRTDTQNKPSTAATLSSNSHECKSADLLALFTSLPRKRFSICRILSLICFLSRALDIFVSEKFIWTCHNICHCYCCCEELV